MHKADEALGTILRAVKPVGVERLPLPAAHGRVLAEDILAKESVPPFTNSAMDGYAVHSADIAQSGDGNVTLRVVGESRAGYPFRGSVRPGCAVRVMTGGVMPAGADAVVPVEETLSLPGGRIEILGQAVPGQHIRRAGHDILKGDRVIRTGTLLTPPHIAILASLGYRKVRVSKRPKVRIIATGDELVDVSKKPRKGKIRNSTLPTLAAYVREAGGEPIVEGVVPDATGRMLRAFRRTLGSNVVLITGGVSVGKYDLVREVLEELGVTVGVHRVSIKPGKPLLFGTFKRTLVFGLPGNPVSTAVTFLQFVRPALHALMGRRDGGPLRLTAILDHDFSKKDSKRHFLRGVARVDEGRLHVATVGVQSSGAMSEMANANCLIIIPEEVSRIHAGEQVMVEML